MAAGMKGGPAPVQLFKRVYTKEKAGDWVEEVRTLDCGPPRLAPCQARLMQPFATGPHRDRLGKGQTRR